MSSSVEVQMKPYCKQPHWKRAGFTMLELLLVLAVLGAAAAVLWPPVSRQLGGYHLKRAAQSVRVDVVRSRILALDAGVSYQFRYEPEGRHYLVMPHEPQLKQQKALLKQQSGFVDKLPAFAGQLPEGVIFRTTLEERKRPQRLSKDRLSEVETTLALSRVSWSSPLVFHPNGTTVDNEFTVVDLDHRSALLQIRGLTGAVTLYAVEAGGRR